MISPHRLAARASVILNACGGHPTRRELGAMTARTTVAWDAYQCGWFLVAARDDLSFLHDCRSRGVASMKWHYRAYLARRASARHCIRLAARHLAQAEEGFAVLQPRTLTRERV